MTRRRRRPGRRRAELRLDPYLAYLIFVALGAGSYRLGQDGRLALLWLVLLAASFVYADNRPIELGYDRRRVGQGLAVGLLLSVPLVALALDPLRATAARLYPLGKNAAVFQGLVLIAAPVEEAFFRGVLQPERGFWVAAGLYALAGVVFFLPVAASFPVVLAAMIVGLALLGVIYGYVALRYGLAASITCHATVNLVLFVLPIALG